jgi:hypothetical protein
MKAPPIHPHQVLLPAREIPEIELEYTVAYLSSL